jgi:hypothetical protein
MPIDRFHRQIAELTLRAASPHGFALAGGNALMAHGLVDRRTQDVDLFTNEEGGVEAAAQVVEAALQAAGLDAERHDKTGGIADLFPGMGEGLAEFRSRAGRSGSGSKPAWRSWPGGASGTNAQAADASSVTGSAGWAPSKSMNPAGMLSR